ncbi:MAG: EndoU domain-containing protein [Myxococcales bacterium]|nr:EndoU domain-containing protein [Myxococcales bacterium]
MRWLGALVWLLSLVAASSVACADEASTEPLVSSLASGVPCGLVGDCARFDALGVHVGGTLGLGQIPSRRLLLAGRTRLSASMLDALDVSVSLGAFQRQQAEESAVAATPLIVGLRVRLWPWLDRGGPDLALSLTQSVPSRWLGSGDVPPETAASVAGSKLWRWLQLDGSVGLLWRDGVTTPLELRLSASGSVRLYQTPDPTLPRDCYRAGLQASALFPLDPKAMPSSLTALAIFEAATDRGLRFALGIGVISEGRSVGSAALAQLSYSWGLRYRTGDGRAGIGGMPDWYIDAFLVDPILEADGCIYTDPSSIGRIKILCIGTPDPIDAGTIIHRDGRRFPVGLHVWIDKSDGTLLTEAREILGRPDEKTAQLAIVVQQLVEVVKRKEQKTGKPCFLRGGILHAVSDASLATMVAYDEQGGGASLLGYELARMIFCDAEPLAGGQPPPLSFGKGPRAASAVARQRVSEVIEHEKPAATNGAPASVTGSKAATSAEAASALTDKGRGHIFYGDVDPKNGAARGWHYEPSGDKAKGTYIVEGTQSPPDSRGVYSGNVMINGVKKDRRSTFFPKDWTEQQVENAIDEAYKNRTPEVRSGTFRGETSTGMKVELRLDGKGGIESAYPVYQGPKYQGSKK